MRRLRASLRYNKKMKGGTIGAASYHAQKNRTGKSVTLVACAAAFAVRFAAPLARAACVTVGVRRISM